MLATDPQHGYYITVEEGRFSAGTTYYTAIAPELPDCLFQADTPTKAKEGLYDVISHLVELMIERGSVRPIPLVARCATVAAEPTSVTTGFSGPRSTPDNPSAVTIPHSTAAETKVFRQEGRRLLAV